MPLLENNPTGAVDERELYRGLAKRGVRRPQAIPL
jgi:hypothetical protein